jgi:hypothetical protein
MYILKGKNTWLIQKLHLETIFLRNWLEMMLISFIKQTTFRDSDLMEVQYSIFLLERKCNTVLLLFRRGTAIKYLKHVGELCIIILIEKTHPKYYIALVHLKNWTTSTLKTR